MVGRVPLMAWASKSAGEASRICLRAAGVVENARKERMAAADRVRRIDMVFRANCRKGRSCELTFRRPQRHPTLPCSGRLSRVPPSAMFAPSRALRAAAQLLKPAATVPSSSSSSATRRVPTRRQASELSTPEQWRRVTKHRPPPTAPVLPPATPLRLPKPPFVQINNSPNPPPTRLAREDEVAEGAEHSAEMEAQAVRERKAYAASQVGRGSLPCLLAQ